MKDYIVLDIENPNSRGNSICAIGIIIVKNNEIYEKKYSLINPEDRFDMRNSEITGIDSSMVLNSPTLDEYWKEIKDLISNNVIVGHNVIYDLSVLSKSLKRYDINISEFNYICTLELSKQCLNLESYRLTEIAKYFNIEYNPHNALEDAMTSYLLYTKLIEIFGSQIVVTKQYKYELIVKDDIDSKLSSNINSLYGIIKGINYDGVINDLEIDRLKKWINENEIYKQYTLFNKIINKLNRILEDNKITEYERIELANIVESINTSKMYSEITLNMQILQGIINGISCDKKIVIEEITNLKEWLQRNDYLSGVYPYDKVYAIVNTVLEDGILSEEEKSQLAISFDELLNPISKDDCSFNLKDKLYCLSGEFKNGSKDKIKQILNELGGIEKSGVSSKVDYLFVGGLGSEAWKYGNVGGKIAKAQELIENGNKIKIISEEELFNHIKSLVNNV